MDILILVLSFGNVIFWILLGFVQKQRINDLDEKFEYLESSLNRHYNYFADYNQKIRELLGIENTSRSYILGIEPSAFPSYEFGKKSLFFKELNELKSILKEAGIIIEPPANISVPDPKGYSVKKVK